MTAFLTIQMRSRKRPDSHRCERAGASIAPSHIAHGILHAGRVLAAHASRIIAA